MIEQNDRTNNLVLVVADKKYSHVVMKPQLLIYHAMNLLKLLLPNIKEGYNLHSSLISQMTNSTNQKFTKILVRNGTEGDGTSLKKIQELSSQLIMPNRHIVMNSDYILSVGTGTSPILKLPPDLKEYLISTNEKVLHPKNINASRRKAPLIRKSIK